MLDVRKGAVSLLQGKFKRSDGLIKLSHSRIKASLVVVASAIQRIVINDSLHPGFRLIIASQKMKGIHCTGISVGNRVELKNPLKISLGSLSVSLLAKNSAAHQKYIWIGFVQIDAEVVIFHGFLLITRELVAPATCIISPGIHRLQFNCFRIGCDCFFVHRSISKDVSLSAVSHMVIVPAESLLNVR